jgi:lipid-binding SYLF domain-containing protein
MKHSGSIFLCSIAIALSVTVLTVNATSRRVVGQTSPPSDEIKRVQDSIAVVKELSGSPDNGIPQSLFNDAEAVVVIPTLVKGGFIVGAKHGRGIMSARDRETRAWSVPIFVTMTGGSIGWQIGLESVDLALLVMNHRGVDSLLDDKFTLGGSLSIAAGPVGRSASAATDAKVTSQILAYSRAQGLFAGATLEGAALHPDNEANRAFYGPRANPRALLEQKTVAPQMPAVVAEWRNTLAHLSGSARTTRADGVRHEGALE